MGNHKDSRESEREQRVRVRDSFIYLSINLFMIYGWEESSQMFVESVNRLLALSQTHTHAHTHTGTRAHGHTGTHAYRGVLSCRHILIIKHSHYVLNRTILIQADYFVDVRCNIKAIASVKHHA